ncbi:MAG TPA: phosphotransferase [Candidatus Yaniella excrementigallinarum]|nr:phosphotransferase [Candidatus Yaniella excrementigallinarum]
MYAKHASKLTHQLLDSVPVDLAAQLQSFDWSQAKIIERGKDHIILIAGHLAVARLSRFDDPDLARKVRLLKQLRLPWHVPTPLSHVDQGVLQRYIPGTAHPHNSGDVATLSHVVEVLENYDTAGLALADPFAQRGRFTEDMLTRLDTVVENKMARAIAEHVHGWTDDGIGAGLVHGDLAGHNMHWVDGQLIGILDWDYAALWDTALNATYLSLWHGVPLDDISATPHRARVWSGALGLYALADALTWDISPAGWRRLNKKVQPRILKAYHSLAHSEA